LAFKGLAAAGKEDKEASAFSWVSFNGQQQVARLAFAVGIPKGLDGTADS
jgi:hypothetical protein